MDSGKSSLINLLASPFLIISSYIAAFIRHTARMSYLIVNTFGQLKYSLKMKTAIVNEMKTSGLDSLPLVMAASAFIGGETVLQTEFQFSGIVPLRYLGMAVCKALTTELCPVIVAFVVSSRVSTSYAAEIGTMKTGEQIDALSCLSLNPLRYLAIPKLVACVIMLPLLVVFGELVAFLASIITAILAIDITLHSYLQGLRLFFHSADLLVGIFKSSVFGAIICFTGVYCGFNTDGGAAGVGRSTTTAVVVSAILILAFDFLIAYLLK